MVAPDVHIGALKVIVRLLDDDHGHLAREPRK
jgi:hypothetical protein